MLVRTWGFLPTRPEHPWIQLEARAEAGAVLRASGTSYAALLACLARVRSGIKQAGCPWPGKALTLHFHPACQPEDLPHLDVPVALLMLAIQSQLPAEGLSGWASTGSLDLAGNLHLPHEAGLSPIPTPAFPAKAQTPQEVKIFVAPTGLFRSRCPEPSASDGPMEGLEECILSATKTGKPRRKVKPAHRGGTLAPPGG